MDVTEIRWEIVDWINLVQNNDQWRVLGNTVIKRRFIKGAEFLD
jgi:hypothetical protein